MAQDRTEMEQLWSIFLQTCRATISKEKDADGKEKEHIMVEDTLSYDAIGYVLRQFNEVSLEGQVNLVQAGKIYRDASRGFFLLLYYQNYAGDTLDKEPLLVSGNNLMRLLTSKIVGSGYRNYKVNMKAVSVTPVTYTMGVPTR
jgi:hypothetical protein